MSLAVWQDAYKHVNTVGFLGDDFCTPLGVYVASLLHGVRECEGGRDVCAAHVVHRGHAQHCGWKPLPDRVKRYVLGMVAPAEKPTDQLVFGSDRKNDDMTLALWNIGQPPVWRMWRCAWDIGR